MNDHNGNHEPEPDEDRATFVLNDEQLLTMMDALAFTEIDHHSVRGKTAHEIRRAIEPLLTELLMALHDTRALGPGDQWTIPIGLDCGFEGDLLIRVRALGPDHKQVRARREAR